MSNFIRASGIWMKPKGQVSKFTCTNTVTSSRTQVKSHKVFQKDSPEVVSEKSWFEKFHKKFTQRNYHEFLSSVTSQLTTSLKKNPITVIFWWILKVFQNAFLCYNTGKATEGTEVFVRICFSKSWSEEFHKIHPKETMMKFFLS